MNKLNKKLVLFDIDGTLMIGGYPAARDRFNHVMKKYLGATRDINWHKLDGTTDKLIMKTILTEGGLSKEEFENKVDEIFEESYQYSVKHFKEDYRERLIKPAVNLLMKLKKMNNVFVGLLTGNEQKVAKLKMDIADLSKYFKFGLYGHEADNRNDLAHLVFKKAKKILHVDFLPENIYIIGDTPHDVECGKFIKARTIAVATGRFTIDELKKSKPDLVVKKLDSKKVIDLISRKAKTTAFSRG